MGSEYICIRQKCQPKYICIRIRQKMLIQIYSYLYSGLKIVFVTRCFVKITPEYKGVVDQLYVFNIGCIQYISELVGFALARLRHIFHILWQSGHIVIQII